MKRRTAITVALIAGMILGSASARLHDGDHIHAWFVESQWQSDEGKTVCQWACSQDGRIHTTTTSGWGNCPLPWSAVR